jgi:hypothetical protein
MTFSCLYYTNLFSFKDKVLNQVKKYESYSASNDIPLIKIKIKQDKYEKLLYQRDTLKKRGNIPWAIDGTESKFKVKAKLKCKGGKSKGSIKIAGHFWDHWKRDPFSLKVKTQSPINGSLVFNLLNSETRGHMTDWFAHKLENEVGLYGLKSEYVLVDLNGERNLYLFEGLYDRNFLKQHELFDAVFVMEYAYDNSNGQVVKFPNNDSPIELRDNFSILFDSLINGKLEPEKLIDFEKMAKFYALGELYQSTHQFYHFNLRYIYNNKTGKIEPVGREYWIEDKGAEKSLFINSHLLDETLEYGRVPRLLFKNKKFVKLYYKEIKNVSDAKFLDKYVLKYKDDFEEGKTLIWNDFPWLNEPINLKVLYENQVWLEKQMSNLK